MSSSPTSNGRVVKYRSAGQRWGRCHWLRVLGLRCFYFPFWRSVNALRRARRAMFDPHVNLITDEQLYELTQGIDEHPDGWDHPCICALCRSYGDAE